MIYYKYFIFLFVLLGCKNEQRTTSSKKNILISEETSFDEDTLKWKKIDSCSISSDETELVLYKNENSADIFKLELLVKGIRTEKKIDVSNEDISDIKVECSNNRFIISLHSAIGNNYGSTYHIFKPDSESNTYIGVKTYFSSMNRNGISISGEKHSEKNYFVNYDFISQEEPNFKEIYSFNGFQEENNPEINQYKDLLKSSSKEDNISLLSIAGDRLVLDFMLNNINLKEMNLTEYNDIAYYLEQAKLYDGAIFLLEKITKQFPQRTVAYINLGDAYWGIGQKQKAIEAYKQYVGQMQENNKSNKIPAIVIERLKSN